MDKRFKQFNIDEPNFSERKMSFTISTAAVDRDGDTIDPKGWMLDNYKRNPVVCWAHDYSQLPVAKAINISQSDKGLHAQIEFPAVGVYPFADTVHDMLKAGFLSATSVGFAPSEGAPSKDRDKGYDFTKQELLEFSIVPVPCNPQALVAQRGVSNEQVKIWTKAVTEWAESCQPPALKAARKIVKGLDSESQTFAAFEQDYLVESEDGKKVLDDERVSKLLALHGLTQKNDYASAIPYNVMQEIHDSALRGLSRIQDVRESCEACLPKDQEKQAVKSLEQVSIDKIKQALDSAEIAGASFKYIARISFDYLLMEKGMKPLPVPHAGEDKENFVSRCMSHEAVKRDFPDTDQRLAVCYQQYEQRKPKADEGCISKDVMDIQSIAPDEIDWESLEQEAGFSIDGKDLDALFLSIVRPTLKEMATAQVRDAMNALTGRVD